MASAAYSRRLKLLARERKPTKQDAKSVKSFSKIEPKKIGIGLVSACLLGLLTYASLSKFFDSEDLPNFTNTTTISVTDEAFAAPIDEREIGKKNETIESESGTVEEDDFVQEEEEITPSRESDSDSSSATKDSSDISATTSDEDIGIVEDSSKSNTSQIVQNFRTIKPESKINCDDKSIDEGFPYARPVFCEMTGDVRISPKNSSVFFVTSSEGIEEERRMYPYARNDDYLIPKVREVILKPVSADHETPSCTAIHDVPVVVFSVSGYTGNFFHDVADVLIPLFMTSRQFGGEVQFVVANYDKRFLRKYEPVLKKLSRYETINFDTNESVHCFRHAFLGLIRDRDLIINHHPTRNPRGYSMPDFTEFLRGAFSLRRAAPSVLGEQHRKRPRMLVISRTGTRKLTNIRQVAAMSEELGFEVIISEARADVRRFAQVVNYCDVLLAVHGAGLANEIFLPPGAVVIQIVPWGKMEWMAENFYGKPAREMKLKYLEYYIAKEESSLMKKYPRNHIVFRNPMAIHGQGWKALSEVIMAQDVKINLRRFRPTLLEAIDLLQE
uniref:Glycosyltransferase 61 catalytic domain-containing protein n=1 Tax=Ananas comosus var. bracteatus TaxID=296719 RepID=A0A6V7QIH4_ANACO|nr:unnamed protein product [Ananas comosus var. bracteatus]